MAADEDARPLSAREASATRRDPRMPGGSCPQGSRARARTANAFDPMSRVAGGKTIAWPHAALTSRPAKACCGSPPGMCSCACRLLM
jgi:hypothetical protein